MISPIRRPSSYFKWLKALHYNVYDSTHTSLTSMRSPVRVGVRPFAGKVSTGKAFRNQTHPNSRFFAFVYLNIGRCFGGFGCFVAPHLAPRFICTSKKEENPYGFVYAKNRECNDNFRPNPPSPTINLSIGFLIAFRLLVGLGRFVRRLILGLNRSHQAARARLCFPTV